jgi:hypothetical protein
MTTCQCRMCQLSRESGKDVYQIVAITRETGASHVFTDWATMDEGAVNRLLGVFRKKYGKMFVFLPKKFTGHDDEVDQQS